MCPDIHFKTHTSICKQDELLLETDGKTNELCLQWITCLLGIMVEGVPAAKLELATKRRGEGHINMPWGRGVYSIRWGSSAPLGHMEASGITERF